MSRIAPFPGYTPGDGPQTEAGDRLGRVSEHLAGLHDEIQHCTDYKRGQSLRQRRDIAAAVFNARVVAIYAKLRKKK